MEQVEAIRWVQANRLLGRILDLPEKERPEAVTSLGTQHDVHLELQKLFNSLAVRSILDHSIDLLFELNSEPGESLQGQTVGDWVIGEQIGQGGMSVVYQATRSGERFEHRAAFKKLSIAFLTERHIESFHRECNVLTTLDHPGIARLIHSGVAESGTPYLIIEQIEGQSIDDYCRERVLGDREIIILMKKLCGAVAHAHRHLVVHRDIKPSNVLIDHRGNPRLLDFGVAKLLGDAENQRRLHAFTPGYAAPEQQQDGAITTATDVFGLGRLMLRLLGEQPRDRELGAICNMATREDPDARYTSAREMGSDLRAWLAGRPVAALPDSAGYRTRKYATRNWQWLSLAGIAVTVAAIGISSTVWQARATRAEAAKHQAVADFMLGLFEQADLMHSGADLRVTELLEEAAKQAPDALASQPDALVSLYNLIASGQIELTNYEHAGEVLTRAQSLIEIKDISPSTRADYQIQRGREAYELGEFNLAVGFLKTAIGLLEPELPHNEQYFEAGANLISYLVDAEQYEEAGRLATPLFTLMQEQQPGLGIQAMVTHRYAIAMEVTGNVGDSFTYYQKALILQAEFEPENQLGRAQILNDYGIALFFSEQYPQAEAVYIEILDILTAHFETPHPRISSATHNLAFAVSEQERLPEAVEMLKLSYAMSVELHGPEHIDSLLEQATLANLMVRVGDMHNAELLLKENIATLTRVAPEMTVQRGTIHSYLGDLLLRSDRLAESRAEYKMALELFTDLGSDHVRVIEAQDRLAEISTILALD